MRQKKQTYSVQMPDKSGENKIYSKIENFINMMFDDEAQHDLMVKHKNRASWAMDNIRVGSLLTTNCSYLLNLFNNKADGKPFVSSWMETLPKSSQIMSLGYQLIQIHRSNVGEPLSEPTYEIRHKWLINDKTLLCNIHPMNFEVSQMGAGDVWHESLQKEHNRATQLLNKKYKIDDEEKITCKLLLPQLETLVNFWSGAMAGNPVRVDAFVDDE